MMQLLGCALVLSMLVCQTLGAQTDESYFDVSALDSACVAALVVTEQQLVEGFDSWPMRMPVRFAPEALVMKAIATEHPGRFDPKDVSVLASCAVAHGVFVHVVLADVDAKDLARSLHIVTVRDSSVLASVRYAWLFTSCHETLLGLPSITNEGRLLVRALRHTFDCDTDAYLATEQHEKHLIILLLDGRLRYSGNIR